MSSLELQVAIAVQKMLGCQNETAIAIARVSIKASREPTAAMLQSAIDMRATDRPSKALLAWYALVDAAIAGL